ncbi:MAG: hypothetical protein WC343_05215 [Bacilli bacterium]
MSARRTRDSEPREIVGAALILPQESRFVTPPSRPGTENVDLPLTKKVIQAIPRRRLDRGLSWVCAIAGRDQKNRCHAALSLAAEIDPTFTINRYCFTPKELVAALEQSQPGQVFVFEEIEISHFYPYRNLGVFAYEYKVGLIVVVSGRNNGWIPGALMIDLDTYLCTVSPDIETDPESLKPGIEAYWYQVMTPYLALYDDPYHLDYVHPEVDGVPVETLCLEEPPGALLENYHEVWSALVEGLKQYPSDPHFGDGCPQWD